MDKLFQSSISFFLFFLDENLEEKYKKLKQKLITPEVKRFLLSLCVVLVPFCTVSIYNTANAIHNGNQKDLLNELSQLLTIIISLILEVIIFCIDKISFLRGTVLTLGIFIYLDLISYQTEMNKKKQELLYFPLTMQIFTIALCYTRSWIYSSISVTFGLIYQTIKIIIQLQPDVGTIFAYIACFIISITCFLVSFYQLDIQNRKDFFNLHVSRKKKQSLKKLFKELPIPLLVKYPNLFFVNEPFKSLFLNMRNINTSRTSANLVQEEIQNQIKEKLNKIKEPISGKNLLDSYFIINNYEEINQTIFQYENDENHEKIELQVKSIDLILDQSEISILMFNNLSEFQMMEKKLENKYQRMLIASFSHDIRTPINGCLGLISKLERHDLNEKAKKVVNRISSSCFKLIYFIDILEDFTLIESNNLKLIQNTFNPSEPVTDIAKLFEWEIHAKKLKFDIRFLVSHESNFISDFKRIREILFVLLSNAIKYTMRGSIQIINNYHIESNEISYSVQDTGMGIEKERFDTLFDLFGQKNKNFTSMNPQGIGLGLYVINKLSKLLSGRIIFESKVNEGTMFTLFVKSLNNFENFIEDVVNISPKHQFNSNEAFQNFIPQVDCRCSQYLVVDDDVTNRKVLKGYIKSINCKCEQACNGEEAMKKVFERANNECCRNFQIIFMDLNMPVMDGIEATTKLKKHMICGELPFSCIIAITAAQYSSDNTYKQFTSIGFDGFYQKPLSKKTFNMILETFKYNNNR